MNQPRLIDLPADPATLPDRQRQAYEFVTEHGPVSALAVGMELGGHPLHHLSNGQSVLVALRRKSLVRQTLVDGQMLWVSAGWTKRDEGPGPGREIPF